MRRTAARVDANQGEIVNALRGIGASVEVISMIGAGVPDLLIGFRGANWLLEVKNSAMPPSRQRLTPAESAWHGSWGGQCAIVGSVDQALAVIGVTSE